MSIDPRRVLIFRGVARAGSFAAAARELGWTQPAVSQHIQALEREVGQPLLLRGHGGVTLTEAGEALLARADAIASQLALAEKEQSALVALSAGTLRVAAYPSAAATLLPPVLAGVQREFSGIDLRLVEAEPPEAQGLLERDEVDAAVVFFYDDDPHDDRAGYTWVPLFDEPIRLVVPRGHDGDVADESWVAGCERCRGHLLRTTARAGLTPRIRHSTDDYVVAQNLVAAGLGVTLLAQANLDAYTHPGVDVLEGDWDTRRAGVLLRDDADRIPAVAAFLRALQGA